MNLGRLKALQAETAKAGQAMRAQAARFGKLATRHADGTAPRAVSSFNLFQTPEHIARRMVETAGIGGIPFQRVLEPSAGLGRILRPILAQVHPSAYVAACEESPECVRELSRQIENVPCDLAMRSGDFLTLTAYDLGGPFDAIVMNPPFERGRDVKHIRHAAGMLAPGGVLVGLCYHGATQERELRPEVNTWEVLPAGSFRSEGTGAGVVMVTIRKGA
jgi:phospholipid N-methyltransferase